MGSDGWGGVGWVRGERWGAVTPQISGGGGGGAAGLRLLLCGLLFTHRHGVSKSVPPIHNKKRLLGGRGKGGGGDNLYVYLTF
jgi:hypothetical protein